MNRIVDVLIIGSGVSGIYSALNINKDLDVLLVTKSNLEITNTHLAQGGISTARDKEDIPLFIEDTLKAGKYKNKIEAVEVLVKESIENINELINIGVNFDRKDGNIKYTKEGAHSVNRIVHVKDKTGEYVEQALIDKVKSRSNIDIYENTYFVDLIVEGNECEGAILIRNNKQINIFSKKVILATGGIGGLFVNSTNQRNLNGDAISVAIKHNIKLKDLDCIQIHPTAFYEENSNERRFLISEAVRGEGAKLLNKDRERFVDELLPRDIVSKAIFDQMKIYNTPYVYLDLTFMDKDYIVDRFPNIYNECINRGIDITKDYIPVSPAQHYFMGGIDVDLNSRSSMKNLYAIGETSCTGAHGANRLASNSLLEGLVFSKRAANDINRTIQHKKINISRASKLYKAIDEIIKDNKKVVIDAIKEECEGFSDELFNYR